MSTQIGSISSSSSSTTSSSSSSSTALKLTDDTKKKLEALGVDTTNITSEAQGQIALLQAQQQQALSGQNDGQHSSSEKVEMEALKSQAITLAGKVGVTVSSDEKISDIIAAIGPAVENKISAAGNDKTKIAEAQELQAEYNSISTSLSSMQAQQAQSSSTQGAAAISSSLNNLAAQNKLYHQV